MWLNLKLNIQAAYVPFQRKRSSQNVVQIHTYIYFYFFFGIFFFFCAVCSFSSCRQGALGCRLLGSCRPGALVLPFMLVQTRSFVPCSLDSCGRGEFVNFVKQSGRGVPHNLHSKEPWPSDWRSLRARNHASWWQRTIFVSQFYHLQHVHVALKVDKSCFAPFPIGGLVEEMYASCAIS